jgi:capsular polysaccharide export protein
MRWAIAHIVAHHVAMGAGSPLFPRYRPHYEDAPARQAAGHARRAGWQRLSRRTRRRAYEHLMAGPGPVFLCALQRPGDSQLWRHSDFSSAPTFIERVVSSFAAHAPQQACLMVRPHPLDPGLIRYPELVSQAAERAGVGSRAAFVDHGKLHEVLPRVSGVVCVNSTAGLAAIEFGKPTITLGRAIYDMCGMTQQGGLDAFWTQPGAPDPTLFEAFRRVVIARTQVNGAFATRHGRRLAIAEVARRLLA